LTKSGGWPTVKHEMEGLCMIENALLFVTILSWGVLLFFGGKALKAVFQEIIKKVKTPKNKNSL